MPVSSRGGGGGGGGRCECQGQDNMKVECVPTRNGLKDSAHSIQTPSIVCMEKGLNLDAWRASTGEAGLQDRYIIAATLSRSQSRPFEQTAKSPHPYNEALRVGEGARIWHLARVVSFS